MTGSFIASQSEAGNFGRLSGLPTLKEYSILIDLQSHSLSSSMRVQIVYSRKVQILQA